MRFYYSFIIPIYLDKVKTIYDNINEKSTLKNKNLKNNIINGKIQIKYIAFLPPHILFPEKWELIIEKNKIKEESENNAGVTDIFKCKRCGAKKCKVTEIQLRSADEPVSKYVVCTVCYTTFIA